MICSRAASLRLAETRKALTATWGESSRFSPVSRRRPNPALAASLAYHPDVRRHVAEMSADLEGARLITYRSAWLSDKGRPTAETTAAYRAKYMVGEAVSRITRAALTFGGAHGIFKTSRLEQLFRDGALGPCTPALGFLPLQQPLGLDPADLLPPLKPG
jgi:alkylation response protein AidB-like acyl-CoA dehydrogenase